MGRLDFPATLTRAGCFFPGVPDIPAAPSENSWQVPGDGYRWLWRFPGRPGFRGEQEFFAYGYIGVLSGPIKENTTDADRSHDVAVRLESTCITLALASSGR